FVPKGGTVKAREIEKEIKALAVFDQTMLKRRTASRQIGHQDSLSGTEDRNGSPKEVMTVPTKGRHGNIKSSHDRIQSGTDSEDELVNFGGLHVMQFIFPCETHVDVLGSPLDANLLIVRVVRIVALNVNCRDQQSDTLRQNLRGFTFRQTVEKDV